MKISRYVTVRLESEGEEAAVFKFRRSKLNDLLAKDEVAASLPEKSLELARHNWVKLVQNLEDVQNLFDDEGKPVTPEEVKDLALPVDIMNALVDAYTAAMTPKQDKAKEAFTQG